MSLKVLKVNLKRLHNLLFSGDLQVATAESATGGLLAHLLTALPGSSRYFKGGLILYSPKSKVSLGVPESVLKRYGTVSPQTALQMARRAMKLFNSDIAIAITGIAGPSSVEGKPVGLFYVCISSTRTYSLFQVRIGHGTRTGRKLLLCNWIIRKLLRFISELLSQSPQQISPSL